MQDQYAIRGWIEANLETLNQIRAVTGPTSFASGWHFGSHTFAFFGAIVPDSQQDAIRNQIRQIAEQISTGTSETGYFHVTCLTSAEALRVWRFSNGVFTEEKHQNAA